MGINVKVQKFSKPKDIVTADVRLEIDLRNCMRCGYFHGNNRQCVAKKCVKEDIRQQEIPVEEKQSKCFKCPYPHAEGYCFPCMKEILGQIKKPVVIEQEEKKDG